MPTYNFEGFIVGSGTDINDLAGTDVPLGSWSNDAYDWTTNSTNSNSGPVSFDLDDLNTSTANSGLDTTSPNASDGFISSADPSAVINAESYVLWNNSVITATDSDGNTYEYTGAMYGIQLSDDTYIVHFQDPDQSSFQGGKSVLTLLTDDGLTTLDVTSITLGPVTEYSYQRNPSRFDYEWGTRPFTCFVQGTLIDTADGPVAVENLRQGDRLQTLDNGVRELRWTGKRTLSKDELIGHTKFCPVRISAGALGPNTPNRDLFVSPQHRVLVSSRIAQRLFGTTEVLIPAKDLLALDGVDQVLDFDEVTYYHIMLDQHEIVTSNGAATESLFAGPEALKALDSAQRDEILTLFPELAEAGRQIDSARELHAGKAARKLVQRHIKNDMPMTGARADHHISV